MLRAWRYIRTTVQTHPFNFLTLIIATVAAACALWAAYETHRQAGAAEGARKDAYEASLEQKADVERSRKAAEKAADTAQNALSVTKDQFRTSQKAYVLITGAERHGAPLIRSGQKVQWSISFINYGHSLALKMTTVAGVWVGNTAIAEANKFFLSLPTLQHGTRTLVPVIGNGDKESPTFSYSTIFSDKALTQDNYAFANANDGGVVLAGRCWYEDIFGEPHHTDFCSMTLASGAVGLCLNHNVIK